MTVKERLCFLTLFVLLIAVAATAQTAPFITSISPEAVYVGSPATTIIFTGTGFASGDIVCFYSGIWVWLCCGQLRESNRVHYPVAFEFLHLR